MVSGFQLDGKLEGSDLFVGDDFDAHIEAVVVLHGAADPLGRKDGFDVADGESLQHMGARSFGPGHGVFHGILLALPH